MKQDIPSESPKDGEPWEPGSHWLWDARFECYRSGHILASRKTLEMPIKIMIVDDERDAREAGYVL